MTRLGFAIAVLALAACQTTPLPQGYRAMGTEPFWDLQFGPRLLFTDRGSERVVAEPAPRAEMAGGTRIYRGRRLLVTITPGPCSDGMSDRSYPDSVSVSVDGQLYRGCGADALFFRRTAP